MRLDAVMNQPEHDYSILGRWWIAPPTARPCRPVILSPACKIFTGHRPPACSSPIGPGPCTWKKVRRASDKSASRNFRCGPWQIRPCRFARCCPTPVSTVMRGAPFTSHPHPLRPLPRVPCAIEYRLTGLLRITEPHDIRRHLTGLPAGRSMPAITGDENCFRRISRSIR